MLKVTLIQHLPPRVSLYTRTVPFLYFNTYSLNSPEMTRPVSVHKPFAVLARAREGCKRDGPLKRHKESIQVYFNVFDLSYILP